MTVDSALLVLRASTATSCYAWITDLLGVTDAVKCVAPNCRRSIAGHRHGQFGPFMTVAVEFVTVALAHDS